MGGHRCGSRIIRSRSVDLQSGRLRTVTEKDHDDRGEDGEEAERDRPPSGAKAVEVDQNQKSAGANDSVKLITAVDAEVTTPRRRSNHWATIVRDESVNSP